MEQEYEKTRIEHNSKSISELKAELKRVEERAERGISLGSTALALIIVPFIIGVFIALMFYVQGR